MNTAEIAALLRHVAAGRRDYASRAPAAMAAMLETEACAFESAARIAEGNRHSLVGLLPTTMWPADLLAQRDGGNEQLGTDHMGRRVLPYPRGTVVEQRRRTYVGDSEYWTEAKIMEDRLRPDATVRIEAGGRGPLYWSQVAVTDIRRPR